MVTAAAIGMLLGLLGAVIGSAEEDSHLFEPMSAVLAYVMAMSAARVFTPLSSYVTTLAGLYVLPVEVCLLRHGETLRQWAARVKQLGIEATCRTNGAGTMREAATRLGLPHNSLRDHLYRFTGTPTAS